MLLVSLDLRVLLLRRNLLSHGYTIRLVHSNAVEVQVFASLRRATLRPHLLLRSGVLRARLLVMLVCTEIDRVGVHAGVRTAAHSSALRDWVAG